MANALQLDQFILTRITLAGNPKALLLIYFLVSFALYTCFISTTRMSSIIHF
jgi:hypothetical protein